MVRSLEGHPILGRILTRSTLLTRSKALLRSVKATKGVLLGIQNYIVKEQCSLNILKFKITMHCTTEKISRSEIEREEVLFLVVAYFYEAMARTNFIMAVH